MTALEKHKAVVRDRKWLGRVVYVGWSREVSLKGDFEPRSRAGKRENCMEKRKEHLRELMQPVPVIAWVTTEKHYHRVTKGTVVWEERDKGDQMVQYYVGNGKWNESTLESSQQTNDMLWVILYFMRRVLQVSSYKNGLTGTKAEAWRLLVKSRL